MATLFRVVGFIDRNLFWNSTSSSRYKSVRIPRLCCERVWVTLHSTYDSLASIQILSAARQQFTFEAIGNCDFFRMKWLGHDFEMATVEAVECVHWHTGQTHGQPMFASQNLHNSCIGRATHHQTRDRWNNDTSNHANSVQNKQNYSRIIRAIIWAHKCLPTLSLKWQRRWGGDIWQFPIVVCWKANNFACSSSSVKVTHACIGGSWAPTNHGLFR